MLLNDTQESLNCEDVWMAESVTSGTSKVNFPGRPKIIAGATFLKNICVEMILESLNCKVVWMAESVRSGTSKVNFPGRPKIVPGETFLKKICVKMILRNRLIVKLCGWMRQ
jgi:hypothetical protein